MKNKTELENKYNIREKLDRDLLHAIDSAEKQDYTSRQIVCYLSVKLPGKLSSARHFIQRDAFGCHVRIPTKKGINLEELLGTKITENKWGTQTATINGVKIQIIPQRKDGIEIFSADTENTSESQFSEAYEMTIRKSNELYQKLLSKGLIRNQTRVYPFH